MRIGASAIGAYRSAIAVTSENVANAENEGFVRRRADIVDLPPGASGTSGVRLSAIHRDWDAGLAADRDRTNADAARDQLIVDHALSIEAALAPGDGAGVAARISGTFDAMTRLSSDPASVPLRREMLGAIDETCTAFRQTGAQLTSLVADVAARRNVAVGDCNSALVELHDLNRQLRASASDPSRRAALEDRRDSALSRLSERLSVTAQFAADGSVTITPTDLVTLPLLDTRGPAVITPTFEGLRAVGPGGQGLIGAGSGAIAGLRRADELVADARAALDDLAARYRALLDDHQSASAKPSLLAGGAAGSLELVVADPTAVAASDGLRANGALLATVERASSEALLSDADGLIDHVAQATQQAERRAAASAALRDEAAIALDRLSGVDLDREAASLIALQQAYGAAARIVEVAKATFDTIVGIR